MKLTIIFAKNNPWYSDMEYHSSHIPDQPLCTNSIELTEEQAKKIKKQGWHMLHIFVEPSSEV